MNITFAFIFLGCVASSKYYRISRVNIRSHEVSLEAAPFNRTEVYNTPSSICVILLAAVD